MDLLMRRAGIAVALASLSCDPLVDASFRGEPLFSFSGQLVQLDDVSPQGYEFRTTLLWLTDPSPDPSTHGARLDSAVEQASASVELRFPSEFQIDIFAPPGDAMLIPGSGLGMALITVYEDRDRNGRLSLDAHPSELVGGAPYEVLVYARDADAVARSPLEFDIGVGFQLVHMPLFCADVGSEPACDVPLGAACGGDGDCGSGGVCLRALDGTTWPDGACVLPAEVTSCLPPDDFAELADASGDVYLIEGCSVSDDCRAGYRCDEELFGCVPADLPAPPSAPGLPVGAACDVPLGAACSDDRQCGVGQCLVRSNGELFPGGYCALPIAPDGSSACKPDGGSEVAWTYNEDGAPTHWMKTCGDDADCRTGEGYECDPWLAVCLPIAPVALELDTTLVPVAPCYGAFGASTRTRSR